MKLTIDRDADALYLDLDEAPAAESEEISPGVILDAKMQQAPSPDNINACLLERVS